LSKSAQHKNRQRDFGNPSGLLFLEQIVGQRSIATVPLSLFNAMEAVRKRRIRMKLNGKMLGCDRAVDDGSSPKVVTEDDAYGSRVFPHIRCHNDRVE
jgi:hypothetical protein